MVRGRLTRSLTLEEYENFLQNPNAGGFTIEQLNEVIFMHGFRKIHKCPKAVLYDALSTVDLMNPPGSTLGTDLSPPYCISFSIDEAKTDLEALNWMDCPIVESIETVGKLESNGGPHHREVTAKNKELAIFSLKIIRKRRRPRIRRSTRWSMTDCGYGFQRSSVAGVGADGGSCYDEEYVRSMA